MANELIEYLRKEEANYLPDPPEGLWDDIERSLLQTKRHQRVVPMWLRYGGVAACIALLFGVGALFINSPSEYKNLLHISKTINTSRLDTRDNKLIAKQPQRRFIPLDDEIIASTMNAKQTQLISSQSKEEDVQDEPATPSNEKIERKTPDNYHQQHGSNHSSSWLARNHIKSNNNRSVSIALYAAGIMANNTSTQDNFMVSDTYQNDTPIEDSPYGGLLILNAGQDMDTKKHYNLPVRTGFRVSVPITKAIAIESGLTYTLLSSSTESGSKENYYHTKQTLHYVGVPVKLRFKLWGGKCVKVYASSGGMVEKCVSGKAKTKFIIGGIVNSKDKQNVNEKQLQLSASLSAGVEANVAQNVSLFVEPDMSYYIDNHSKVDNVYKDRPLNFGLNLGLRVNLNK